MQWQATGQAGTTKQLYTMHLDEPNGDTYLVAWRPRLAGDPHPHLLQPNVIAKLTGAESRFIANIGTVNGSRTNPTLVVGNGSDISHITRGRTAREIDDVNYRSALAGTTHLTELRRQPELIKDLEFCEFTTRQSNPDQTIVIGVEVDKGADAAQLETLDGELSYDSGRTRNGRVQSNGFQRLLFIDDEGRPLDWASGRTIKPRITYASDVSTQSPRVISTFRLGYRIRSEFVRVYTFAVELRGDSAERDPETQEQALLDMMRPGDGEIGAISTDLPASYVRVEHVTTREVADRGGGDDSNRGRVKVAEITVTEWTTG